MLLHTCTNTPISLPPLSLPISPSICLQIDFTSAFVKHAKATAERATCKGKETAAADSSDSHKKSKGQKCKPTDSGQHSSHKKPKSSSKHGTKYGTVFKSREGSRLVDSSSGVEINGTAPVVSGANGYDPACEEEDDLSPTDMSEVREGQGERRVRERVGKKREEHE